MYYIGIDLGTSSVKILLVDENGRICFTVTKEYPLYLPHPGWSEQRPEDWWNAVTEGLQELTSHVDKEKIAGIGCAGQMHGLVLLDEKDEVIRPAILWNDSRTAEETEYLNSAIGKVRLSKLTANIAFAGFTAPKLLWVKQHEPENFDRIAKIMLPKDYINYQLTGVHACDYSDASGMLLLDVKNRCWSKEMLEICGISEKQMPQLYESWETIGTVKPEIAAVLGLPKGVKVAAGAGDNAAAAVPGLWVQAAAISVWEPPARSSSPRSSFVLIPITPSMPLPMRTAATILWAVCSAPHPATNGCVRIS